MISVNVAKLFNHQSATSLINRRIDEAIQSIQSNESPKCSELDVGFGLKYPIPTTILNDDGIEDRNFLVLKELFSRRKDTPTEESEAEADLVSPSSPISINKRSKKKPWKEFQAMYTEYINKLKELDKSHESIITKSRLLERLNRIKHHQGNARKAISQSRYNWLTKLKVLFQLMRKSLSKDV